MTTRLFCAAVAMSLSATAALARPSGWAITERRDPFTGRPEVTATARRVDLPGGGLSLRCEDGAPFLVLRMPSGNFVAKETAETVIKIDDWPVRRRAYAILPKSPFVAARLRDETYARLRVARRVAVEISTPEDGTYRFAATLPGDDRPLRRLVAACPKGCEPSFNSQGR